MTITLYASGSYAPVKHHAITSFTIFLYYDCLITYILNFRLRIQL